MDFHGNNLNLAGNEPSGPQVVAALEQELNKAPFKEVVFCGYGEPTMRLDTLLFTAQTLKGWQAQAKYPPFKIRLNTNGFGNMIHQRNIVPELARVVDCINISLNAENEDTWRALMQPEPEYAHGYEEVCSFIRLCAQDAFERVVVSCVAGTTANAQAVKEKAASLGATFYLREFLDEQA